MYANGFRKFHQAPPELGDAEEFAPTGGACGKGVSDSADEMRVLS